MKRLLLLGFLRLVVFGLLGSTIWAVLAAADFVFVSFGAKLSRDSLDAVLNILPYMSFLAGAYGLAMGIADFVLLRLRSPYRMAAVALAGIAAMNYLLWTGEWLQDVSISVIGAVPAALCSLLCGWAANTQLAIRWISSPAPRGAALPAE